ncbi:ATP-binding cassette domain-containing protein [Halalkalibaculum sp. DA3122]|uniref:ABC transporter ATP-binding protein n=1 Tax=unclassified Halalkalibaculum TaxID=2964617 RepID=UPI003754B81F
MFSVEVHNLSKRYGATRVLENLSFSFEPGITGIGGSNGSGKSTLLKCLAGLLNPTTGTITWKNGTTPLANDVFRSHLGYVAPYINLYHELSVRENMELILKLRKKNYSPAQQKELWERLQLAGLTDKPFGDLSTGQQQRARLASTLSYHPSILFLDEPGANLDKQGRATIRQILDNFRDEQKIVLLASNNPSELDLADQIFSVE